MKRLPSDMSGGGQRRLADDPYPVCMSGSSASQGAVEAASTTGDSAAAAAAFSSSKAAPRFEAHGHGHGLKSEAGGEAAIAGIRLNVLLVEDDQFQQLAMQAVLG